MGVPFIELENAGGGTHGKWGRSSFGEGMEIKSLA